MEEAILQASPIWTVVNTVVVVILAIVFMFKQWKVQTSAIDAETIESLKRQLEALKGEMSGYQTQIQALTLKIGEQSGIIRVQEATIAKYEKILENRNPELTAVLGEIRDFMKGLEQHNVESMGELKRQTQLLLKE